MPLKRVMVETQEKAARLRTKYKSSVLGSSPKMTKGKKNFLHILHSLLLHSNIVPMKPIVEESCKEIKWKKKSFFSQRRFGQQSVKRENPPFLWFVFVLAFPFVQFQL